jgi:MinD superfamily P-loop ATPase
MTIAVASGKGGTGKTTVAVGLAEALAASKNSVRLLDCDVEEPNDHLFIGAEESANREFLVKVPRIDEQKCTACEECVRFCEFHALVRFGAKVMVFDNLCHGCGGCGIVCPEGAITEIDRPIGRLVSGKAETAGSGAAADAGGIDTLYGILDVGEVLAPPLIRAVKREGGALPAPVDGLRTDKDLPGGPVIVDSPPGTTCPMVTAVKDADFALLVTENTPFGLHDLELAIETISEMNIPMGVVINRADVGRAGIEEYCRKMDIPVLMKIPYDETVAAGCAKGRSIVSSVKSYGGLFLELYAKITRLVAEKVEVS